MADPISKFEAIEQLSTLSPVILEHLVKLLLYPKSSSVKHWEAELDAWIKLLTRYHRRKGGGNFRLSDFVYCIYQESLADRPVMAIIEAHGPAQSQIDGKKIRRMVEDFGRKVMDQVKTLK